LLIQDRANIGLHRDAETFKERRRIIDIDPVLDTGIETSSRGRINPSVDVAPLQRDTLSALGAG
jgi:hypothetical protein